MNKEQKRAFYAAIQSHEMPENYKEAVYRAMRDALAPKPAAKEKKIRKVKTKSPLMTLQAWETERGEFLNVGMLRDWIAHRHLCTRTVAELVAEFRMEMFSKGKEYADFVAAFQTYLNKGYLSKKLDQALWINSPHRKKEAVRTLQAGASI